jgi:hypothetical protein
MQAKRGRSARGGLAATAAAALRTAAACAGLFGVLTIGAGARALFGGAEVGAAVPFVLWFNFLAGFVYVAAAYGLWRLRRWAALLALALAIGTGLVFMAFGIHVTAGGAFETRTVIAMTLRTLGWGAIAGLSALLLLRRSAGADAPPMSSPASGKS